MKEMNRDLSYYNKYITHIIPNRCPNCESNELENIDLIYDCEHVEIHLIICLVCQKEFIGYKLKKTKEMREYDG
jgi:hypothetical protein